MPDVPGGAELFRGFLKVSENFDTLTCASRRRCCWQADATARQSVPNTEKEEKEETFLFLLAEGGSGHLSLSVLAGKICRFGCFEDGCCSPLLLPSFLCLPH